MTRTSSRLIVLAALIVSVGLVDGAAAQHYYLFGQASGDSADGSGFLDWQRGEPGASDLDDLLADFGKTTTAEIDITIEGNVLTAVIRNTSPDQDNYGGNPGRLSPSIIGFGFDVIGESGASVGLVDWSLTTNKTSGSSEDLDDAGTSKWNDSNTDNLFEFTADEDGDGLYNPDATGGWGPPDEAKNVTETILVATFEETVNLIEALPETFTPFVRFGNVGSAMDPQRITVVGTLRVDDPGPGNHSSPEPASVFVWTLGIATCVGVSRRWRSRRAE